MTAEILIMNKNNIALASDSAVTLNNKKTFFGANKIFELSNQPSMGLMIYGNSEFAEIPLESLITTYTQKTNFKEKNSVNKIAKDFLKFLETEGNKHGSDDIIKFGSNTETFEEEIYANLTIFESKLEGLNKIVSKSDDYLYNFFEKEGLLDKIQINFDNIINKFFKNEDKELINPLLTKLYISSITGTGIIIAGYNEASYFPSMVEYRIFGLFNGKILYKKIEEYTNHKEPLILPFAQSNVINNFLFGFEENILNFIINVAEGILNNHSQQYLNVFKEKTDFDDKYYEDIMNQNKIIVSNLRNEVFKQTIYDSTLKLLISSKSLSKEKLTQMCESLINLTSLKSLLTSDVMSVGGDVIALLSKREGFNRVK